MRSFIKFITMGVLALTPVLAPNVTLAEPLIPPKRALILGEVVHMHVRPDCLDEAGRYVNPEVYQPIARLHADNYVTSDNQHVWHGPSLADVLAAQSSKK